jgi:D-alanyl-D-alanine carboxypeptidase/D-alanyl-D-alanine-endopeptidase (penicillin-binding protein 4)
VGASIALPISLFAGFFACSQAAAARPTTAPHVAAAEPRTDARVAAIRARALPARLDSVAALTAELSRDMRLAGSFSGAYVADLDAQRTLFSYNGDVARSPASTEKLYTTSTALARFGPAGVLQTTVLGIGPPDLQGVMHGDLYLRGDGDPTFGSEAFIQRYYGGVGATVTRLARALEATGVTKVEGSIVGDESLFDSNRGTPPSGFALYADIGAPLTALSFDRGHSGLNGPAGFAASQLAAMLRNDGVNVTGPSIAGSTPPSAVPLASVASPPLRDIVALTNGPSDNFFAETLLKSLGAHFGGAGTTAAGAAAVRRWLAPFGIRPRVYDGSGLDRADHTSPRQLVTLLRSLRNTAVGDALKASLPVAGRSGTLIHRMRGTAAAGRCEAKTGTLANVSALAGYCSSGGGDEIGFAIVMNNNANVLLARTLQDRIAASLAVCGRPCARTG